MLEVPTELWLRGLLTDRDELEHVLLKLADSFVEKLAIWVLLLETGQLVELE